MIKQFSVSHLGPLNQVTSNSLGPINLIIGGNSAGKTFLLRPLRGGAFILHLKEGGFSRQLGKEGRVRCAHADPLR